MYNTEALKIVKKMMKANADRAALQHIYCVDGFNWCTDGHRLYREIASENAATGFYTADGHKIEVDASYPDCQQVIPRGDLTTVSIGVEQFNSLPKKLSGPYNKQGEIQVVIKGEGQAFNLGYIVDALPTFHKGSFYYSYVPGNANCAVALHDESTIEESALLWVIMPLRNSGGMTLVVDVQEVE